MPHPPNNSRSWTRRNLQVYLSVVEALSQEPLGRLGNLSVDGFLILSPHPYPIGAEKTWRILLPAHLGLGSHMDLRAIVKWSVPERTPGLYATGCYIQDHENSMETILHLLTTYSY